jgi:hypothetical protein
MYSRQKKLNIFKNLKTKKRYYKTIKYPIINTNKLDRVIATQIGTRLDKLAKFYYGDSTLWWVIALANPDTLRKDSMFIKPGLYIRIPSNIQKIKEDFELLNK